MAERKDNGGSIFRYVYADSQKELTVKLRKSITAYQRVDLNEQGRMAQRPENRGGLR